MIHELSATEENPDIKEKDILKWIEAFARFPNQISKTCFLERKRQITSLKKIKLTSHKSANSELEIGAR